MKLTRLPLLLLALVVSVLAAPGTSGAKPKGVALVPSATESQTDCDWVDFDCGGESHSCCGSTEGCLTYCDHICGDGVPGTCYIEN